MIVIVSTTLIYADIKQVFRGAIDTQLADYCNKRTDGQTNGHTDERDGQSYKSSRFPPYPFAFLKKCIYDALKYMYTMFKNMSKTLCMVLGFMRGA